MCRSDPEFLATTDAVEELVNRYQDSFNGEQRLAWMQEVLAVAKDDSDWLAVYLRVGSGSDLAATAVENMVKCVAGNVKDLCRLELAVDGDDPATQVVRATILKTLPSIREMTVALHENPLTSEEVSNFFVQRAVETSVNADELKSVLEQLPLGFQSSADPMPFFRRVFQGTLKPLETLADLTPESGLSAEQLTLMRSIMVSPEGDLVFKDYQAYLG